MNAYVERVINEVKQKYATEPEFVQTVEEVLSSVSPLVDAHPEYEENAILERMIIPERTVVFRVPWEDDKGNLHVNTGYRVQYSSAIGPYKGGLRVAPSVNMSIIKFLGFEQTFKDALSTLPIGGAKGGSDFDPNGKSDKEVQRFCASFMQGLFRFIGPDVDCPAGDLGVGAREIGYMFGAWRRLTASYANGALSGKDPLFGGSAFRPEATGFGAVYYLQEVLKHENDPIEGKRVAVAGFGNVSWGVCTKLAQLGAKAVTLSGPDGYIYDPDGITTQEKIDYMLEMRASGRNKVQDYADKFGVQFFPGQKPWGQKDVDIIMPCATQNDVNMDEAKKIVANGVKYYIEVANMPTTNDALRFLMDQKNMIVAPSKAVNCGGVSVSALEMSQNSERLFWDGEEVDKWLHKIMKGIHDSTAAAAEKYGLGYNLVAGANLASFEKVANAMIQQGRAF